MNSHHDNSNKQVKFNFYLTLFLVAFCLSLFPGVSASVTVLDPHAQWITTETEHFIIISEADLKPLLPGLVQDCETAYTELGPLFQWRFTEKPTVMYSDNSDQHNGWATSLSHPTMLILAAPPRNQSYLAGPCQHRKRTIYHELTHLLHSDASYGFIRRCHSIFGRVTADLMDPLGLLIGLLTLPPANAAPSWYLEGESIWAETQFAGPGRGQHATVDAFFRTIVDQNRFMATTSWHLRAPDWPFGNSAYLYGMKAIQESALRPTANETAPDVYLPGRLGEAVAKAPLAGWFNSQALEVGHRDFMTIARDTRIYETAFQQQRINILESQPVTRLERWSPIGVQVTEPVWQSNNQLCVVAQYAYRQPRLSYADFKFRILRPTGPRVSGGWSQTASNQDGKIYFNRLDSSNGTDWRGFLYCFDRVTGKTTKLTQYKRVMDVACGPGNQLATVCRSATHDSLYVNQNLVWSGIESSDSVISSVVFHQDKILFVVQNPQGSVIRIHDANSYETVNVIQMNCNVLDMVTLSEQSTGVIADANGVFNLYELSIDQKDIDHGTVLTPLTHTMGGVYGCSINPNGRKAALIGLDADGYFLAIVPVDELQPRPYPLPTLPSPWQLPETRQSQNNELPPTRDTKFTVEPWEPLKNLRFDYWSPWLNGIPGSLNGGLVTRWSDRTMTHSLLAVAGWDSDQEEFIGNIQWNYRRYQPEFSGYLSRQAPVYSGLIQDNRNNWFDLEEIRWKLVGNAAWKWHQANYSASVQCGWLGVHRSVENASIWQDYIDRQRIKNQPLLDGFESSFWATASINTAKVYPRSLSLENGIWGQVSADMESEFWGSDIDRSRLRGDFAGWLAIPIYHHVLKVSASYGVSWGDSIAQGAYTVGGFDNLAGGNPPGLQSVMALRGYQGNVQSGDEGARIALSYRFPLYEKYRSLSARSALYLTQIMGEVFYETAAVWDGNAEADREWYKAIGAEINAGTIWFSHIDLAPGIGFSYMTDEFEKNVEAPGEGDWSIYFSLKSTINF